MKGFENMTGQRFGRWTVLGMTARTSTDGHKRTACLCRCDCGTERVVYAQSQRSGLSKSCGCAKPVPLTTDILINNGFGQDTIGSGLILHIDNSENLYVLVNYRYNGECRNVEISNRMYNLSRPIRYVHELQHALRLCGLSELADNLKI